MIRRAIKHLAIAAVVTGLAVIAAITLWAQHQYQTPIRVLYSRFMAVQLPWYEPRYPSIQPLFTLAHVLMTDDPLATFEKTPLAAIVETPEFEFAPGNTQPRASTRVVATPEGLILAVEQASPGDVIELAPGLYDIPQRIIGVRTPGRADARIVVRGAPGARPRLLFGSVDRGYVEGFQVTGPYWTFENLELEGVCADHVVCEHAFHVVGAGKHVELRDLIVRNFNAPVKVNLDLATREIPDDGLIEGSYFHNDAPRKSPGPVNMLDLVAASRWVVRGNVYADFGQVAGKQISYGPYMKGAGSDGLMERNLVICSLTQKGGTRIGISLGGGGSGDSGDICADNACAFEHKRGIIRNNVVMNCSDVGIYLNDSPNAFVAHNSILNTAGIDVRFPGATATLINNVIDGRIRGRDGGSYLADGNVTSTWRAAFLLPLSDRLYRNPFRGDLTPVGSLPLGVASAKSGDDICGRRRPDAEPSPVGAVLPESATDCARRLLAR
jgi:parallel beta-helix repeat protein